LKHLGGEGVPTQKVSHLFKAEILCFREIINEKLESGIREVGRWGTCSSPGEDDPFVQALIIAQKLIYDDEIRQNFANPPPF